MLTLYTGTPGSGKSLGASRSIYYKLINKKLVFANFGINFETFKKGKQREFAQGGFFEFDMYEMDAEFFQNYARAFFKRNKKGRIIEGQAFIYFDECQNVFGSEDWNMDGRRAWRKFFSQHRKYGYNIVLITQPDKGRGIDRKILANVEYEIKHRKMSNYKWLGKVFKLICLGEPFMRITYWYVPQLKDNAEIMIGRRKWYDFFDSGRFF